MKKYVELSKLGEYMLIEGFIEQNGEFTPCGTELLALTNIKRSS